MIMILITVSNNNWCQSLINLKNPSFEERIINNRTENITKLNLKGWINLGDNRHTPPTHHSKNDNIFNIRKSPTNGNFFIELVTRFDTTWEGISQILSTPMKANKQYEFSLDICTSKNMKSPFPPIKNQNKPIMLSFNKGAILRIQGTNSTTGENQILSKSSIIRNTKWQTHYFLLKPEADYDMIIIEAFFDESRNGNPYVNANILIDNCQSLIQVSE